MTNFIQHAGHPPALVRTAAPSESGAPPCEEFDDPGPSFTFSHVVTRA